MKNPINFVNNHFIFANGEREYFSGEKEFIALPSRQKIKVNNSNLWNCIKEIVIPISQMCANIKGHQFINNLNESMTLGFYDCECNDKEDFILGYVNEKLFENPQDMIKEMLNYDVLIGFNIFRFDNELLRKYAPEQFIEVKNADFIAYNLNGKIMIDLYSIISVIVGLESYSAESLAKYNGFNEELLSHESDKNLKCLQDIRILKFLWEKYNIPKVFNTLSTLANLDTTLMQIIKGERLRKWILVNKYLRSGFLPLKTNKARSNKIKLGVVKYSKNGTYESMKYLDIRSTYPTTAINLGNLGIYDNDNTFSKLQEELAELSKDKELKPFTKSIANALVGSEYSLNEFWRNDDIYEEIVKTVAEKVKEVLKKRKDIVYTNTDCFVVPKDSPDIKIDGYEIKTNYEFDILHVYNANKWIGKTKERIEFRGFRRLNSKSPRVLLAAREEVLSKLSKAKDKEEFKEILDDSEKIVSKTLKGLKKCPLTEFKMTVRKKDEYCRDLEFSNIWKELNIGFNTLYYNDKGDYTLEEKKVGYKFYKELILNLAEEYSTIIE